MTQYQLMRDGQGRVGLCSVEGLQLHCEGEGERKGEIWVGSKKIFVCRVMWCGNQE